METQTAPATATALINLLLKEADTEAATTRKFLALVPANQPDFKPHSKSMSMHDLAVHLAELPSWMTLGIATDGIDFATMDYTPTAWSSTEDLLRIFETSLASGRSSLEGASEETLLNGTWTMRHGEHVIDTLSKYEIVRVSLAQTIHHRAQLGVYLRMLDIPIPGSYGPTADYAGF